MYEIPNTINLAPESVVFRPRGVLNNKGVLNTNDIDPSEIEVDLDTISHLYYVSISAGIVYRF